MAFGLGRNACSSKPSLSIAVQSHCKAHFLLITLNTASWILASFFGAYMKSSFLDLVFRIRRLNRTAGLARAYAWISRRILEICFDEFLSTSCCRTGRALKRSVTLTVVPNGADACLLLCSVSLILRQP